MKKAIKRLSLSGTSTRVILPIILIAILAIIGWLTFKKPVNNNLDPEEAKTVTEEFINEFLMAPGSKATVKEIEEVYGLYKVKVDIVSDIIESFTTKDGKIFFPQAFYVDEVKNQTNNNSEQATPVNVEVPKTNKPNVELFVMSHCPYGTQIEKGILPVIKTLGDKIDFELKFVDYAMHGEIELQEQLAQYCIQKEQSNKFIPYLECFLLQGNTNACLAEVEINQNQLDTCIEETDSEYKITENFENNIDFKGSYPGFTIHKDENTKYGVAGSPALIINETQVQSARDPQSLLNIICSAFNDEPEECSTTLSPENPAPGFGTETTANASNAACN
jgi:glutaredoxin